MFVVLMGNVVVLMGKDSFPSLNKLAKCNVDIFECMITLGE